MPSTSRPRKGNEQIKVGFFSLSRHATDGDDRGYLEWHQLDHMPEQYQLPGLLLGQRWATTPACEGARAAAVDDWAEVAHVVCYLMGNPVEETLDEFFTLGRALAEKGRMARSLPSQYLAGLRLLEAQAAPRTLISSDVVPYRPHQGIYLIVEEPTGVATQDDYLQQPAHRRAPHAGLGARRGRCPHLRHVGGHPAPVVQPRPLPHHHLLPR